MNWAECWTRSGECVWAVGARGLFDMRIWQWRCLLEASREKFDLVAQRPERQIRVEDLDRLRDYCVP